MATTAFKVGSGAQDAVTGIKHLYAAVTANSYTTFLDSTGAAYQVPAGKTFYITKITASNTAASRCMRLDNVTSTVSNSVASGAGQVVMSALYTMATAYVAIILDVFIPLPENKILQLFTTGVEMYCNVEGIEI